MSKTISLTDKGKYRATAESSLSAIHFSPAVQLVSQSDAARPLCNEDARFSANSIKQFSVHKFAQSLPRTSRSKRSKREKQEKIKNNSYGVSCLVRRKSPSPNTSAKSLNNISLRSRVLLQKRQTDKVFDKKRTISTSLIPCK